MNPIYVLLTLATLYMVSEAKVRTSGRLVARPRLEKCKSRPKHYMDKRTGHYYFFSGGEAASLRVKGEGVDVQTNIIYNVATLLENVNHISRTTKPDGWMPEIFAVCTDLIQVHSIKEMCMDLVSIETEEENVMVEAVIKRYNVYDLWTSGRLCNFHGCEAPHLQPKNINGWFWSGSGQSIPATNETAQGWRENPWSQTGFLSQFVSKPVPQPDNAEYLLQKSGVTVEACMAVQNNWYGDGISWHDTACYRTKPFMCEDSDVMMNVMKRNHPNEII